ncbi:chaplin [Streptomyces vinaceus]|uniref:chaplin n=1 Tax=Streptomyces vinaceus TaxID=1960 RepID=UPI00381E9EF9
MTPCRPQEPYGSRRPAKASAEVLTHVIRCAPPSGLVAPYSPGVLSGNLIQIPVHIPINACGNSVSVIGLLNPAFGNTCINS